MMDIDIRSVGGTRPPSQSPGTTPSGSPSNVSAELDVNDTLGVSVKLTDTASLIQSAVDTARQGSAIDPAKVAALREAIATGRYLVDAKRVAEKFMRLEPDL